MQQKTPGHGPAGLPSPLSHPLPVLPADRRSPGPPPPSAPRCLPRQRLFPAGGRRGPGPSGTFDDAFGGGEVVVPPGHGPLGLLPAPGDRQTCTSALVSSGVSSPGPVSPPCSGPGSSGRPRYQKEEATAAGPRTSLTRCGPTGRSLLRSGVGSAGGSARQPRRPLLLAARSRVRARARSCTPLSQLPGGPRAAAAAAEAQLAARLPCSARPPDLPPRPPRQSPTPTLPFLARPEARAAALRARVLPFFPPASDGQFSLLLSLPSSQLTPPGLSAAAPARSTYHRPLGPARKAAAKQRPSCDPAAETEPRLPGPRASCHPHPRATLPRALVFPDTPHGSPSTFSSWLPPTRSLGSPYQADHAPSRSFPSPHPNHQIHLSPHFSFHIC